MILEPKKPEDKAIIMEFKVQDTTDEKNLSETVQAALQQIEERKYEQFLHPREYLLIKYGNMALLFVGKKFL